MANWFKWWNYPSFWKLFGVAIGAVVICLFCALFIPGPWYLIPIGVVCLIGRFLIKRLFPNVADDIIKESNRNEEEK